MKKKLFLTALILLFSLISFSSPLNRQKILDNSFAKENGQVKIAFFDADSTLRVALSGNVTATTADDVMLLPWVEKKIAELNKAGFLVAIASNQGGIANGFVTQEIADGALYTTIRLIRERDANAIVHYFDYAEANDSYRKPEKGMGLRLESILREKGLTIDWAQSFMVGDSAYKTDVDHHPDGRPGTHFSNADRLFAKNLGISFFEPNDFFGWRQYDIDVFNKPQQVRDFMNQHRAKNHRAKSSCLSFY